MQQDPITLHITTLPLHPFNGLFSRTSWVSRYQKGKTSLDLNEARDDGVLGRQWHQLDHMQTICTSLQTDNHTNTSSLNFYRPNALPDTQRTVLKHWSTLHIRASKSKQAMAIHSPAFSEHRHFTCCMKMMKQQRKCILCSLYEMFSCLGPNRSSKCGTGLSLLPRLQTMYFSINIVLL